MLAVPICRFYGIVAAFFTAPGRFADIVGRNTSLKFLSVYRFYGNAAELFPEPS